MAEIELSALSKQCLDRRIAEDANTRRKKVNSWAKATPIGLKLAFLELYERCSQQIEQVHDTIIN